MSGRTDLGYKMARKTFENFDSTVSGKDLKKKDYQTWAIWRSGIAIRTINALILKGLNFNKKEMSDWLKTVENQLKGKNFSYRNAEIKSLKEKLQKN
jgi:hypothetical protein